MSKPHLWPVLLCITLVVSACSPNQDTPSDEMTDETEVVESDSLVNLEPTRTDTILLEGMPEVIQLTRYVSPQDFPIPFSTYYPVDMVVRDTQGDMGLITFLANFQGNLYENARVEFQVFPPNTDLQTAYAEARQKAEAYGSVTQTTPQVSSAISQFTFSGNDTSGYILVGEHEERLYSILVTYPVEFGDGFPPRVNLIFNNWRWLDTNTNLVPSTPTE